MSEVAIRVEELGKMYRIGAAERPAENRWQVVRNTVGAPFEYLRRMSRPPTEEETLWALRDVSFEVGRGEVIGVIGRNGAGKSTLLKILSRITEPTHGRAEIHGRVGSLLEVGTGFHPELTGRENIYLSGTILGMRKGEIDRKFDEIVDFAGVEKFIDTPVKRYSSGMNVRLGFAVAAHLEPEILLVDEVLAVGDVEFQRKCLGKMSSVAHEGRTVLFVSHNMGAITRLCSRVIWLDTGSIYADGFSEELVSTYLTKDTILGGRHRWEKGISNNNVEEFKFRSVQVRMDNGEVRGIWDLRQPFWVEIEYEVLEDLPPCRVGFRIATLDGVTIFAAYDADQVELAGVRTKGRYLSRCYVPGRLLAPNRYVLSLNAGIVGIKNLSSVENILLFELEDIAAVGAHSFSKRGGIIRPELRWESQNVMEAHI